MKPPKLTWTRITAALRAPSAARWQIERVSEGLRLGLGSQPPFVMPVDPDDDRSMLRLKAVLMQAMKASAPGAGGVSLTGLNPTEQARLERLLAEVLGPGSWRSGSVSKSRMQLGLIKAWRQAPRAGLSLLVILVGVNLMLTPAEQGNPVAPVAPVAVVTSALGTTPADQPVGWLESISRSVMTAGVGSVRALSLEALPQGGVYRLEVQLNPEATARVMGGSAPAEGLRQSLSKVAGQQSVTLDAERGLLSLVFVPARGAAAAGLSAEAFATQAAELGLQVSSEGRVADQPVQRLAQLLGRVGPALSWSSLERLSLRASPNGAGLASLQLELRP